MRKKIVIIGNDNSSSVTETVASLKRNRTDIDVVVVGDTSEITNTPTFTLTAPLLTFKDHLLNPKPTRAERRRIARLNDKKD